MHYLIHAANTLQAALPATRDHDPQALLGFFTVGCETLTRLRDDGEVQALIRRALADDPEKHAAFLQRYAEQFLAVDRALMISSGMDPVLVSKIFSDTQALRVLLREPRAVQPNQLQSHLLRLQVSVCRERELLQDRELVRQTMNTVCGAAVVVVNGTSLALIGDFTGAVSGLVGGFIMNRGLS